VSVLLPGFYVSSDTALHRLDPRVKMGAAMMLMVLPFAAPNLASNLLLLAFVLGAVLASAVPAMALLRTLRTVLWAGLFMFLFRFFTTPGQPVLTLGRVEMTWEGLAAGGVQIYRLCLLVVVSSLLTFTTSPSQRHSC
jgi:energy-coupling factor transport system permease protein